MKFTLVRKVYSGTLVQALKAVENVIYTKTTHYKWLMVICCLMQFQRRNRIYKEEQRKLRAAARKGQDDGKVAEHH